MAKSKHAFNQNLRLYDFPILKEIKDKLPVFDQSKALLISFFIQRYIRTQKSLQT